MTGDRGTATIPDNLATDPDVVVIGAGQAGLAVAYFLRRTGLSFVLLDAEAGPGGAWRHAWSSLHLFSPAQWSSLPGWPMPDSGDVYPPAAHVVDYLARYEQRYRLPVVRPVEVSAVSATPAGLIVQTGTGQWKARAVVSATGTWRAPVMPHYPGLDAFGGMQTHSAAYESPERYRGKRVLVIGGGNSAAQILADVSLHAQTHWAVKETPRFLPDDVDGRVLFERATERWHALQTGRIDEAAGGGLASIVMVPAVREARARGVFDHPGRIDHFTGDGVVWADGSASRIDAVIWCTGFRPALRHLESLGILDADGRVAVSGTRARNEARLWLVGYGEWTGFASATLIGVMRGARDTVREISAFLEA